MHSGKAARRARAKATPTSAFDATEQDITVGHAPLHARTRQPSPAMGEIAKATRRRIVQPQTQHSKVMEKALDTKAGAREAKDGAAARAKEAARAPVEKAKEDFILSISCGPTPPTTGALTTAVGHPRTLG